MKIIKSICIVLIISSLLMGVTGCMTRERYKEEVIKEMLGYLEEKYDEKFIATSFLRSGNGFNRPVYDEAYVYPESDPEKEFAVQRRKKEDSDEYILRDGYALRQAEELLEPRLYEMGNRIFGKCKVELTVDEIDHVTEKHFSRQLDLDDFIQRETSAGIGITITIGYSGEFDADKQADKVCAFMNEMLEKKYHGNASFIFTDEGCFEQLKEQKVRGMDLIELHKQFGIKHVTYSHILNYEPYEDTKTDIIERFNKNCKFIEDYNKRQSDNNE